MTRWGRGWEVGVNKTIEAHELAQEKAAVILAGECGTVHARGERVDLCPRCQADAQRDTEPPPAPILRPTFVRTRQLVRGRK